MEINSVWIKVKKIADDILDDDSLTLSLQDKFENIEGWDSLKNIEIYSAVQETFNISLVTKDLEKIKSFIDLCNNIKLNLS